MEDLDRAIVRLLAADGRMSYTDLGKATGLSTSAVHQRVRRSVAASRYLERPGGGGWVAGDFAEEAAKASPYRVRCADEVNGPLGHDKPTQSSQVNTACAGACAFS